MNYKKNIIISLGVVGVVVLVAIVFRFLPTDIIRSVAAQDTSPTSLNNLVFQPQAYISDIKLDKDSYKVGEKVIGTFSITNGQGYDLPDAYYKISLAGNYQKNTLAGTYYDHSSLIGPIFLAPNEKRAVNFEYTLPAVTDKNGLGIQIQAFTKVGDPLGWSDEMITVTGDSVGYLVLTDGNISINKIKYYSEEGPTVKKGETALLSYSIYNSLKNNVTLTPKVSIYKRGVDNPQITRADADKVVAVADKNTAGTFALPNFNDVPGVYVGEVSFFDANGLKRVQTLTFRYIIGGDVATIRSVSSNVTSANKGDTIALKVSYSGTPLSIEQMAAGVSTSAPNVANLNVVLKNDKDEAVGQNSVSVDFNNGNMVSVPVVLTKDAGSIKAFLEVKKGDNVLTNYSTVITDARKPISLSRTSAVPIIITALIFLIIAIFVSFYFRKKKTAWTLVVLLILMASLLCLAKYSSAWVTTSYGGGGDNYWSLTYTHSGPNSSSVYNVGDQFYFTGNLYVTACTNTWAGVGYSLSYGSQALSGSISPRYSSPGIRSIGGSIFNMGGATYVLDDHINANVQISVGPFTVQKNQTRINVTFTLAGGKKVLSGYQDIQVRNPAPPVPTNLTPTCSADGKSIVFSWKLPAGYTNSYFGNTSVVGSTYTLNNITPGLKYTWSVQTRDPLSVIGWASTGSWSAIVNGSPIICTLTPTPTPTSTPTTTPTPTPTPIPTPTPTPTPLPTPTPSPTSTTTCSTVPTSAYVGSLVTWTVSGSTAGYAWSGDNVPTGSSAPTGASYSLRYSTIGRKSISLVPTAGGTPINCTAGGNAQLQVINNPNIQEF